MNLSFEHANYKLKSNSLNIEQEGVVVMPKKMPPLFIPNEEEIAFYNDKWSYQNDTLEKLSRFIRKSENIIDLWDEIECGSDCWSKTLLDINSKIVIAIYQSEGYYQNELVAKIENTKEILGELISDAYDQDLVINKHIYDIYMEVANINLLEFLQEYKEPDYLHKISKLYMDKLPEELKNRVIANSL